MLKNSNNNDCIRSGLNYNRVILLNNEEIIIFLQKLRDIGIKISLDDFGPGYSSINYLSFMLIDKVKIDKSINDRYLDEDNYNIIKHIINLSHELDLKVVAEGIESKEQLEIIQNIGCDYIQGYIFSEPLDAEAVEKLL